jgi:hypothetical protein
MILQIRGKIFLHKNESEGSFQEKKEDSEVCDIAGYLSAAAKGDIQYNLV